MNQLTHSATPRSQLWLSTLLSSVLFMSCASAPSSTSAPQSAPIDNSQQTVAAGESEAAKSLDLAQAPKFKPQLVKNAELSLMVKSIEKSLSAIDTIVKAQQGDVLGLRDQPAGQGNARHTLSMQIRVPQAKLEATLENLSQLGTIQQRNLTAEDVSDQLVDFDARLRNLRKTEETLLGIMGRSGSVGDVLKVAQQLSQTREQIEQVSAQYNNLKNRVAYSTITLEMEEILAGGQPQRPVGSQFQETWEQATRSLANLTVDLGRLGIWLLVYTPYWLVLGGAIVLIRRRFSRRPAAHPPLPDNPAES